MTAEAQVLYGQIMRIVSLTVWRSLSVVNVVRETTQRFDDFGLFELLGILVDETLDFLFLAKLKGGLFNAVRRNERRLLSLIF